MTHPARGDADAYQRYFAGMDASMDQKAGFLSAHLLTDPGARILDLGCGSGALSARMAVLARNARVTGIDIDPGTIGQAEAAHVLPNLDFVVGDAAASWEPADAVVSCSLLHHVYTYAPRPYDEAAAEAALRAHVASLRSGGLLVLRDFCRDGAPGETCLLDLSDEPGEDGRSDADLLRDFAVRARPLDPLGSGFPLEELGVPQPGWRRFRLHRHWSAEFLLRKDYREDWEAELREEYAFWPLQRFAAVVEDAGARVIHAATVRNPWVVRNRFEGQVRRMDERHRPLPWPPTNMVLVAQRVADGQALRLRHRRLDGAPPSYLRLSAWRDAARPDGETLDLVQRPTGAVDFLPYATADGRLRVLARNGWPRPATVMMGRGEGTPEEIRSGHVVEMISMASDGTDPAADFRARSGLELPEGVRPEPILSFLPSAGTVDEVARGFVVKLDRLPSRRPAPRPPDQVLDCGVLQSFDAAGLLRAAEVGMLPEARLELTIRALFRRLGQAPGRWAGEAVAPLPCDAVPVPWADASRPEAAGFVPAAPTGFLRRVRSVFSETLAGDVPGGNQVLEMALPTRHGAWTVSVLPIGLAPDGTLLVGLEQRRLPAAQLGFGNAALPTVPAWRLDLLPEAPEPLRAAAGQAAGCDPARLTPLGAAYHSSLGLSPERVQPFTVPWGALPPGLRDQLRFVPLREILDDAASVLDGHLLIAAFRLACATGLDSEPTTMVTAP